MDPVVIEATRSDELQESISIAFTNSKEGKSETYEQFIVDEGNVDFDPIFPILQLLFQHLLVIDLG